MRKITFMKSKSNFRIFETKAFNANGFEQKKGIFLNLKYKI